MQYKGHRYIQTVKLVVSLSKYERNMKNLEKSLITCFASLQKITSLTNIISGASVFLCTGMTTYPKFFFSSLFYVFGLFSDVSIIIIAEHVPRLLTEIRKNMNVHSYLNSFSNYKFMTKYIAHC